VPTEPPSAALEGLPETEPPRTTTERFVQVAQASGKPILVTTSTLAIVVAVLAGLFWAGVIPEFRRPGDAGKKAAAAASPTASSEPEGRAQVATDLKAHEKLAHHPGGAPAALADDVEANTAAFQEIQRNQAVAAERVKTIKESQLRMEADSKNGYAHIGTRLDDVLRRLPR